MLNGGKYKNSIILDNYKDALLVAGVEGFDAVKYDINGHYPVTLVIQKERSYFDAVRKSLQYSKMGVYNCIIKI